MPPAVPHDSAKGLTWRRCRLLATHHGSRPVFRIRNGNPPTRRTVYV